MITSELKLNFTLDKFLSILCKWKLQEFMSVDELKIGFLSSFFAEEFLISTQEGFESRKTVEGENDALLLMEQQRAFRVDGKMETACTQDRIKGELIGGEIDIGI